MFVQGNTHDVAQQIHRLESRGSILDVLLDETRRFSRDLGADDKARLDQYVTSVREVEELLQTARVRPHALHGTVGAGVGLHAHRDP
jgi:hypothetical protein